MALAATITDQWDDGKRIHVVGTITPSGSYSANGDSLDLTSGPTVSFGTAVRTSKQPIWVSIWGKAGFVYQYDLANKKMLVFLNTAGGANNALGEHTAIAYVAGVTGDTIKFYAIYPRG